MSIFGGGLGWWGEGGAHAQAIFYTSPSKLPSWHKPERVEDLSGANMPREKFRVVPPPKGVAGALNH